MHLRQLLISSVLLPSLAEAQQELDFAGLTWSVRGAVKVESLMGEEALRMRSGAAYLSDFEFSDGTIEFDVAFTGHRSFVGIAMRLEESTRSYEHFYLRPHQSKRFDAMQYTPVNHGISAWQLYPEYNAPAVIPQNRWVHVRLVLTGSKLEVYVDRSATPALLVDKLARGHGSGLLALTSGVPGGEGGLAAPPDLMTTAFANFVVRPSESHGAGSEKETDAPGTGVISRWAISPAFSAPEQPPEHLPGEMIESDGWITAVSDGVGRINLAEYRGIPQDADRGILLARVVIRSDRDQTKKLNLGFSDEVSIFLNGEVIFTGNNTYLSRSGRYLGVMTLDNDALYLPLRRGENELVAAVTEGFGGWGLTAKLGDMEGISVSADIP